MKRFAIRAIDKADSGELRARTRPVHLAYLKAHASRIVAAGALLSDDDQTPAGSLLIVEMHSADEARNFIEQDPYAAAGLFAEIEISAIRLVYPSAASRCTVRIA